ncbi:MAG: RDD family protein [Bacteroidia bacterium]
MKTIVIPTTQNIELEYPLATVGDRIGASIIDSLIKGGYFILLQILFDSLGVAPDSEKWLLLLFALPVMHYDLLFEILWHGQTVGKRLMNIRVIKADGSTPDIAAYFLRWVFRAIEVPEAFLIFLVFLFLAGESMVGLVMVGLIGTIAVAMSKKSQRIGDMTAGTAVVKLKLATTFDDTIFVETKEDHVLTFPEIENLSDRDVSILKEVLDAGLRSNNPEILRKLADKVKKVAQITSKQDDKLFLHLVLKDYNYIYGRD